MNLDRLIKLLKLANHNSIDGEANSAARAACKILAENNYKWIEEVNKNGGRPPRTAAGKMNEPAIKEWTDPKTGEITLKISQLEAHDNPRIFDLIRQLKSEIERPKTWNDVHRSKEPWWKATSHQDWHGFDFDEGFYENKKPPPPPPPKKEPVNWTWTQEEENGNVRYKKVYNQSIRNCTKCGYTQLTSDDTSPFVCYNCKRKEGK